MPASLLVLDGACSFAGDQPRFHRVRPPTDDELKRPLDTLIRRIVRKLTRSGALLVASEEQAAQPYLDLDQSGDDALQPPGIVVA